MKAVKKSPAKKVAPKAAAKKPMVKAVAPQKPMVKAVASKKPVISPEQRYKMTEEAAYYIAERHGFNGDSQYFWSLAVAEIDAKLK